ncbi:hypothetical protein QYE76_034664 [Lolium multiflorum]|uniref:Retrotransposon gag domain-containing protein n=1 Tax=Lolium multiflorum TaxID=4521 RepID=A0AAD8QZD7_LOLMU|nr:hypothetical protein QYE76_034664 [Lolium multiflorum]
MVRKPAPSMELPVYNTPDKNILATEAAAKELNLLEGEELRRQTHRVADLCRAAAEQTKDPRYGAPKAPPARAGNSKDSHRDTAESSSPAPAPRDSRVPRHAETALTAGRIPHRGRGAGLPQCFGPRIANEPMIDGFQLPRDTPKYDGTAKPEDWLLDYSTAVGISRGNKRWAVRYSPLMLVGSARTWLNNLPAGSINGWLDFEEAFISNFTGTYRRPGRQQLEMCKQGPDETDRAYLTRWCEMRNSCEGVHEIQAISFFMGGCRPNTMLWHKLRRSEPKSMASLAIAAKHALAEEAGKATAEPTPAPSRRDHHKWAKHKPATTPLMAAGGTTTAASVTTTSRTAGTAPPMWQPCQTMRQAAAVARSKTGNGSRSHCCRPIGRITLEVMFGKPDHFRTERIEFGGGPRRSYHALLGRPATTKFMVVPHYGAPRWPRHLVIATEKQLIHDAVALAKAAQTDMPAAGNPAGTTHFQPADNTKKILLDPAQPDKYVTIGAGLSKK